MIDAACHIDEREHRMSDEAKPRRYDRCDGTCTVDCGHCKGNGPPVVTAVPLDGDRLREIEADASSPFASIRTRGVSALVAALRASWAEVERLREVVAEEQAHCTDERFRLAEERDEARAALAAVEALHRPIQAATVGGTDTICAECRREPQRWDDVVWPCPTIAASRTAAADKENDR